MTIRSISRGEGLAFLLLLGFAGYARAQQENRPPLRDPNFLKAQGAVTLAPNAFNAGYLTYEYHFGPDNPPNIDVAFKGNPQAVTYYGFDGGNTSWLGGPGGLYTVKGNVLSQLPKSARLPRDLRNGSPAYYAAIGGTSQNASAPGRQEESPVKDPNFPKAQGDVALASNPYNATHMTYEYTYGADSPPYVNVAFRSSYQTMTYYGFDSGDTSWLGGNGGFYTIKGNVITQLPRTARLPKDLRNGSPAYYAEIGVSKGDENNGVAATAPVGGSPASSVTAPAGATVGIPRPVAAAPGSTAGTDVRIERGASGTTLHYRDESGEHSYKVRRPATASAGVDRVDAGGWVYVAPDGKSGLLLNVSPNHSVIVMPLAQPMLGMLAGRGGN
jgi:hypothetical protein